MASYTKGWPLVGDVMLTSDRSTNLLVATLPPPPEPPTFLNNPACLIAYVAVLVKSAFPCNIKVAD